MKIATWNVNSLRVRLAHVLEWITDNQPDVLCLQELKLSDAEFPREDFLKIGYQCVFTGQKTYNGVAIVSKQSMKNVVTDLPNFGDEQRRYIAGDLQTAGGTTVRLVNVYAPNGQALDSDKFAYKRIWFSKLQAAMHDTLTDYDHVVLVGDFNITPTDLDVYAPERWRGKIHCSDIERLMLHKLMSTGLFDTYRQFNREGDCFSWWDYRTNAYDRNEGLRIDLILSSSQMLDIATNCCIDETPRKLERPSDHTPVMANYEIPTLD